MTSLRTVSRISKSYVAGLAHSDTRPLLSLYTQVGTFFFLFLFCVRIFSPISDGEYPICILMSYYPMLAKLTTSEGVVLEVDSSRSRSRLLGGVARTKILD